MIIAALLNIFAFFIVAAINLIPVVTLPSEQINTALLWLTESINSIGYFIPLDVVNNCFKIICWGLCAWISFAIGKFILRSLHIIN